MNQQLRSSIQQWLQGYEARLITLLVIFSFSFGLLNVLYFEGWWLTYLIFFFPSLWIAYVLSERIHSGFLRGITLEEKRKLDILQDIPHSALIRVGIKEVMVDRLNHRLGSIRKIKRQTEDEKKKSLIETEIEATKDCLELVRSSRS